MPKKPCNNTPKGVTARANYDRRHRKMKRDQRRERIPHEEEDDGKFYVLLHHDGQLTAAPAAVFDLSISIDLYRAP